MLELVVIIHHVQFLSHVCKLNTIRISVIKDFIDTMSDRSPTELRFEFNLYKISKKGHDPSQILSIDGLK